MIAALALALLVQQPAGDALLKSANKRLNVPCGPECDPPKPDERYRLGDTDEADARAPRAVDDTGGKCSVVGDRLCTRPPRKLFSTPLPPSR